jgi:hypothetical protein
VGKDLLDAGYGALRTMLRRAGVRAKLRTLARDLGRALGSDIDEARQAVQRWEKQSGCGHHLPQDPSAARAVVRGLAQWVLDFKAQSTSGRFPFDRPLLDLYERCVTAARATDAFMRTPPQDAGTRRVLARLARTLEAVAASEPMARSVASLRMRAALFDELRATLRLRPSSPTVREAAATAEELRDIQQALDTWGADLRARRPARGPAEDRREAIDVVLDHLDRHGDSLFGHEIQLPAAAGGGTRLVDRTNNVEETYFRDMKHRERRRSGRKILTQDFESLPPAAALVPNLSKPDYLALLCGTLEDLPAAFAEIDATRGEAKRGGRLPIKASSASVRPAVESASLPTVDRRIVRSAAMGKRIEAAAKSRAPRTRRAG